MIIKELLELFKWKHRSALLWLRFGGILTNTWPVEEGAPEIVFYLEDMFWWIVFINFFVFHLSVSTVVIHSLTNTYILSTILPELLICTDCLINMILFKMNRKRIQKFISIVINYINKAKANESQIIEKYFRRYSWLYVLLVVFFILGIAVFVLSPLFEQSSLPTTAYYPFQVDYGVTFYFAYFNQVVAALETLSLLIGDLITILFIWYVSARLDLLKMKFLQVKSVWQLRNCVKEHQHLIRFIEEVSVTISPIIMKTMVISGTVAVTASLELIRFKNLDSLFIVNGIVFLTAFLRLFCSAWPASDLIEISQEIGFSVYDTPWTQSLTLRKNMVIVILRCQRPLSIKYKNFKVISKEFIKQLYSTVMSYTVTVIALAKDED